MERRAIDMWMDPLLLDAAMFFERIADAHREAESRRLVRLAEPDRAERSWWTLVQRLVHLAFMPWARHRIERIIRNGASSDGGRTSWDTKRTQHGVP